ncbi:glycosyltransferase family 2 protein [Calothrix sp. UHCC 0171]|uniref:glycosyltransferase family 2 protein n=1 Tax=Calothrix sp. UHCC 0171 TaxID=3110245 RepID=UPI002B20ACF8|nr:glycosyltransferase family 2 protein [Calothrix sp. UHCC 0171]MEA5573933.1 glycosyltransferase family 2 protein [Calothrix sp. UHCC 0171]
MSIIQLVHLSIEIFLSIGASGLFILGLLLLVECIAAIFPVVKQTGNHQSSLPNLKVAILVPAHNEETVITNTLSNLKITLKPQDELVVIADNCRDRTATIARNTGAIVLERKDSLHLGKGYALDYGLQYLANSAPDVVVFIDADCQVDKDAIAILSEMAMTTGKPVQANYLMTKPSQHSPKDSISAFAFKVKNLVRSQGMTRLGLPCLLAGTGMAFPWSVISSINTASADIVEDMKLGLDLSIVGYPPIFCPHARVIGNLPQNTEAAKSQRTRWEHGHLQTILTYVPKLFLAGLKQRRSELFLSALDLCIPPLSLLVVMWMSMMFITLLFFAASSMWIPLGVTGVTGFLILTAILISWTKFASSDLPLRELLAVPIYILWKIPLYCKFLIQPQKAWIRTERD